MKPWNKRAIFLLMPLVLTSGCLKSYYVGNLTKHEVIGTWEMIAFPKGIPIPPAPQEDCQITLNDDGSFDARNFPLIIDPSPEPKIRYVTEQGTWNLIDKRTGGTKSRWELNLGFSRSHYGVRWDVIGSPGKLRLFGITDIDFWDGFEFAKNSDNP